MKDTLPVLAVAGILLLSSLVVLNGCTTINFEEVNIQTVATNCDVVREAEKEGQGAGSAGVDVVTRKGDVDAAAAMAEAFGSSIYCKKDVIAADVRVAPDALETEEEE